MKKSAFADEWQKYLNILTFMWSLTFAFIALIMQLDQKHRFPLTFMDIALFLCL